MLGQNHLSKMEDIICGEKQYLAAIHGGGITLYIQEIQIHTLMKQSLELHIQIYLVTNYDAAKVKMGGNWRMPTRAECTSLINNCEIKKVHITMLRALLLQVHRVKVFLFLKQDKRKRKILDLLG